MQVFNKYVLRSLKNVEPRHSQDIVYCLYQLFKYPTVKLSIFNNRKICYERFLIVLNTQQIRFAHFITHKVE